MDRAPTTLTASWARPMGVCSSRRSNPSESAKLDAMDRVSVVLSETHGVGSIGIDSKGRIIGVERTCTDPGGRPEQCTESPAVSVLTPSRSILADRFEGKPLGRLNDLVVDGNGHVYFTVGGAYYVGANGTVKSLGENIRANGIMLSRDEKIVYVDQRQRDPGVRHPARWQCDQPARLRDARSRRERRRDGHRRRRTALCHLRAGRSGLCCRWQISRSHPDAAKRHQCRLLRARQEHALHRGQRCLGPDGQEFRTPDGVRNNAKTIYRLPMLAEGFRGRAK